MTDIVVTGASGYLATHLVARLLRDGHTVRGTVRDLASEPSVREAVRRGGADDGGLTLVAADLSRDDGWKAAVAGAEEIHHVATPFPVAQPADPDEVIVPAREGTLRVLRAARDAGARRVVLTSSFAAVGYSPKAFQDSPKASQESPQAVQDFTEDDWTDPDTPGLAPYPRSKAIAERAAWDLLAGSGTELVAVNPTFILGPSLVTSMRSSIHIVASMLDGSMTAAPRGQFGLADVRDVADLHVLAMATPEAAGKRFLALADGPSMSFLDIATVLRRRLGATRTPVTEVPGGTVAPKRIHNDRAKALGWRPRDAETTIVETAESLYALGLVPA
jgi:nucleoside-diphosphate-sugar epimerase